MKFYTLHIIFTTFLQDIMLNVNICGESESFTALTLTSGVNNILEPKWSRTLVPYIYLCISDTHTDRSTPRERFTN